MIIINVALFLAVIRVISACGVSNLLMESNTKYWLSSANFPDQYPNDWRTCYYTAVGPEDHYIITKCNSFSILYSTDCYYSAFYFSPSGDSSFSDAQLYCGTHQTLTLESHWNYFAAAFYNRYDNIYNQAGFECSIEAIPFFQATTTTTTATISPPPPPTTTTTTTTTISPPPPPPTTTTTTISPPPSPPSSSLCGRKNVGSRIVGGQETELNVYPWMVYISFAGKGPSCGGVLISEEWVLTAAHCLDTFGERDIEVTLGDHDTSTTNEAASVKRAVIHRIAHEDYNSTTIDNDIGLLKLRPVEFSATISPICLPYKFAPQYFEGKHGTAVGWGAVSNFLQYVSLPILTNHDCNTNYASVRGKITGNMICTYEFGKDACQGDSGGPLQYEENGITYAVGIVSWGIGCAQLSSPGVFAKVNNYLGWIQANTGQTFPNV